MPGGRHQAQAAPASHLLRAPRDVRVSRLRAPAVQASRPRHLPPVVPLVALDPARLLPKLAARPDRVGLAQVVPVELPVRRWIRDARA